MTKASNSLPDIEVATQTVNLRVYDRLRDLILGGHLKFGDRLDERDLAERMKVSRTPLREAIGRLAAEGVVEKRPYLGHFVRSFTRLQIHDLYDVRAELEVLAAQQAVTRCSSEEVEELAAIINACHAAYEDGDLEKFEAFDQKFHEHIALLSRNQTLAESLGNLRLQIGLVRHYANETPSQARKTIVERNAILDAFQERDPRKAGKWMRQHIMGSREAFSARIDVASPKK